MRKHRVHKKDEYLSVRLPRADKERLEIAAKDTKRDPSDLAWVLICKGLDHLAKMPADQKPLMV